jgi:hypothetical protein
MALVFLFVSYTIKASDFCFARDSNGLGLSVIRMALAFGSFSFPFCDQFSVHQLMRELVLTLCSMSVRLSLIFLNC